MRKQLKAARKVSSLFFLPSYTTDSVLWLEKECHFHFYTKFFRHPITQRPSNLWRKTLRHAECIRQKILIRSQNPDHATAFSSNGQP